MKPPPRRLTVAAAVACSPWYRVHSMTAKLQRELGRLDAPPGAEANFKLLERLVQSAVDEAGACVEALEAVECRKPTVLP